MYSKSHCTFASTLFLLLVEDIAAIEINVSVYDQKKVIANSSTNIFFCICPLWNGLIFGKFPNSIVVPTILKILLMSENDENSNLE